MIDCARMQDPFPLHWPSAAAMPFHAAELRERREKVHRPASGGGQRDLADVPRLTRSVEAAINARRAYARRLRFVRLNVSDESQENQARRISRHNAQEEPLIRMHTLRSRK